MTLYRRAVPTQRLRTGKGPFERRDPETNRTGPVSVDLADTNPVSVDVDLCLPGFRFPFAHFDC